MTVVADMIEPYRFEGLILLRSHVSPGAWSEPSLCMTGSCILCPLLFTTEKGDVLLPYRTYFQSGLRSRQWMVHGGLIVVSRSQRWTKKFCVCLKNLV